jgi:shikimate dehydrogenase
MPLGREALGEFNFVADFVYRTGGSPLIAEARSRGIDCVDGLELLVAQGALAFELFTARRAPVGAMRAAVGL